MAEKREDDLDPIDLVPADEDASGASHPKSKQTPDAPAAADGGDSTKRGTSGDDQAGDSVPSSSASDEEADDGDIYAVEAPPPVDDPGAARSLLLDEPAEAQRDTEGPPASGEAGDVPEQPKYRSESEQARIRAEQRARRSQQMKEEYQRKRKVRLTVACIVAGAIALAVVYFAFIR